MCLHPCLAGRVSPRPPPAVLRSDDVLIVSIGGNDVALRPTFATIAAMLSLTFCWSRASIASGWAWGSGHFERMYQRDGAGYLKVRSLLAALSQQRPFRPPATAALQALMSRCTRSPSASGPAESSSSGGPPPVPACVALCTIYFPDQARAGGAASSSAEAGVGLLLMFRLLPRRTPSLRAGLARSSDC